MRQAYRIIPVYTADVSGVCSALYELGGMTVMHDPSGCNSTYNTHDEIRWYDQDSLIFISGLTEIDAVMGNDEKFLRDIEKAAGELHPRFIALAGSPIPFMNGTDFPALAQMLEEDTGIPAFSISTNGMHDYVYGAGLALAEIAKRFTDPEIRYDPHGCGSRRRLNLLGVTPLDFGPASQAEKMKERLEGLGWEVISTWAMGDDLGTLSRAGGAAVNLAVSSAGIPAAKVLEQRFGTPYVIGTPVGKFAERLSEILEQAVREREAAAAEQENGKYAAGNVAWENSGSAAMAPGQAAGKYAAVNTGRAAGSTKAAYLRERPEGGPEITLIGEPVTMGSLAAAIRYRTDKPVRVLCPLEGAEGLLAPGDKNVRGEEEAEEELRKADIIVADPLYRPVCPEDSRFYGLPHIAFSGRIYLKKISDMALF